MSTRAVIAREVDRVQGKFVGRYHHSDGYPMGLGQTLWDLYNGHFQKDLQAMLKVLLDDHPAGWSTINGKDFNLEAGYVGHYPKNKDGSIDREGELYKKPHCFCHGDRQEEAWEITEEEGPQDQEWAYVFMKDRPAIQVLYAGENGWESVGIIDLEKPTNFGHIECGDHLERCPHVEGYHERKAS